MASEHYYLLTVRSASSYDGEEREQLNLEKKINFPDTGVGSFDKALNYLAKIADEMLKAEGFHGYYYYSVQYIAEHDGLIFQGKEALVFDCRTEEE